MKATTIIDEMAGLLGVENTVVMPRKITARAVVPQTLNDKANATDGIWVTCEYHGLTFDAWYRVEGIYVPATEFDAEERPDVVIVRFELYGSEIDFDALPLKLRNDIIEECRGYESDAR